MHKAIIVILASASLLLAADHKDVSDVAQTKRPLVKGPVTVITLDAPPEPAVKSVKIAPRDVISINTRVWNYTWLVFDEKIITTATGDPKHFLTEIADERDGRHVLQVKPALEGRQTNLQVLTDKGTYSFLLREVSQCQACDTDLKLLVESDGSVSAAIEKEQKSRKELAAYKEQIIGLRDSVRLTKEQATARIAEAEIANQKGVAKAERDAAEFKKAYPASQSCNYKFAQNKSPFFIGSICNDGAFTFIYSRDNGLATPYSHKTDGMSLVVYDYIRGASNHQGVYVLNGVVTDGYLQSGKKKRLKFRMVASPEAQSGEIRASR
jgi:hypothetical protein